MNSDKEYHTEYFAGCVSPLASLGSELYGLKHIIKNTDQEFEGDEPIFSWTSDVCIIALVAYYEGFCRNLFSTYVNICPNLLDKYCQKRPEVSISLPKIISVDFKVTENLGFILAEELDFGSTRKVNSHFFDLLGITPFNSTNRKKNFTT